MHIDKHEVNMPDSVITGYNWFLSDRKQIWVTAVFDQWTKGKAKELSEDR